MDKHLLKPIAFLIALSLLLQPVGYSQADCLRPMAAKDRMTPQASPWKGWRNIARNILDLNRELTGFRALTDAARRQEEEINIGVRVTREFQTFFMRYLEILEELDERFGTSFLVDFLRVPIDTQFEPDKTVYINDYPSLLEIFLSFPRTQEYYDTILRYDIVLGFRTVYEMLMVLPALNKQLSLAQIRNREVQDLLHEMFDLAYTASSLMYYYYFDVADMGEEPFSFIETDIDIKDIAEKAIRYTKGFIDPGTGARVFSKINFVADVEKGCILPIGSKGHIFKVLSDSIRNSLFAFETDEDGYYVGTVVVRARVDRTTGNTILTITDNGDGMSASELKEAFYVGYTTKPYIRSRVFSLDEEGTKIQEEFIKGSEGRYYALGGLGLGVPKAEWITRFHGGSFGLESNGIQGTTLLVVLPLGPPVPIEQIPRLLRYARTAFCETDI